MQVVRVTFVGGFKRLFYAESIRIVDFRHNFMPTAFQEKDVLYLNAPSVLAYRLQELIIQNPNGNSEAPDAIRAAEAKKAEQSFILAAAKTSKYPNIVSEPSEEGLQHE